MSYYIDSGFPLFSFDYELLLKSATAMVLTPAAILSWQEFISVSINHPSHAHFLFIHDCQTALSYPSSHLLSSKLGAASLHASGMYFPPKMLGSTKNTQIQNGVQKARINYILCPMVHKHRYNRDPNTHSKVRPYLY